MAQNKLLVLQHVAYEPLGTLNPLLKTAGFRIRYVNFSRTPNETPSLEKYDGLVILGGPMSTYQTETYPHLKTELKLIEEALTRNLPTLGICLGAQLLATALGANVRRHHTPEIGWATICPTQKSSTDPLFKHFQREEPIFQWHSDSFELPNQTELLATGSVCPNQAFRYGSNTYGMQFHLEVDEAMILRWLHLPEHQQELGRLKEIVSKDKIRQETQTWIRNSQKLSKSIFSEFIRLFEHTEKKTVLRSGHRDRK